MLAAFFLALSRPISTSLRIASERFGRSGSRRLQSSIFLTHAVGATMFSRWISSSSFVRICHPIYVAYLPIICIIRIIEQYVRPSKGLEPGKELTMTPFCLDAALDARVDAVARMLADKAESFAEYYLHGATPSRSADPDPREFIRQKADDARDIVAVLSKPVGFVALSMAARRLAKHYLQVGDFKMHGEMVALANSLVARAA